MWQPLNAPAEEPAQRKRLCAGGSSAPAGNSRSKLEGTFLKADERVVQETRRESVVPQPAGQLGALCLGPYSTRPLGSHLFNQRDAKVMIYQVRTRG